MKPKEKGDQLEDAIESLENTLFGKFIGTERPDIKIERNVFKKIDGVGYEIDLLITVNPGSDYESVFLFECKNWDTKKIGWHEVTILNEKVKVWKATKGYLLAKTFNSGAKNKAKEYSRMELLDVNENVLAIYKKQVSVHKSPHIYNCRAGIFLGHQNEDHIKLINGDKVIYKDSGEEELDLYSSLKLEEQKILEKVKKKLDNGQDKGRVPFDLILNCNFPNDVEYKNGSYSKYFILLRGTAFVYDEKLISRFDIEKRGRHCIYEYLDKDEKIKQFTLTDVKPLDDQSGNSPSQVVEIRFDDKAIKITENTK